MSALEYYLFMLVSQILVERVILSDDIKACGASLSVGEYFTYICGWLQSIKTRFGIS